MSQLGHKQKSSVGLGMSGVGGGADVISGKADISAQVFAVTPPPGFER